MIKEILTHSFGDSSLLLRGDYDPMVETMKLYFRNGSIYEYCGVPKRVYKALTKASSAGRYFSQNIRGQYDDTKTFDSKDIEGKSLR